jgi:hypothetical protein
LIIGEITDMIEILSIAKKSFNSLFEFNIFRNFSLMSEIFFLYSAKVVLLIISGVIIPH